MGIALKITKFGSFNCRINLMGRKDVKNRPKAGLAENQLNYTCGSKFIGRPTVLFLRPVDSMEFPSDEKHFLN